MDKLALYFGCLNGPGHYLFHPDGRKVWADDEINGLPWEAALPWNTSLMDTGLLVNGKRPDVYDGKVYWTCGGVSFPSLWFAFYWWDRSIDKRGASNSGFYAWGFDWPNAQEAFDYACSQWPQVVARQAYPLILQDPPAEEKA